MDSLNDDIERFAETFAEQNESLERMEIFNKKLQLDIDQLKSVDAEKAKKIGELEVQLDLMKKNPTSHPEWIGSEIGRLWQTIEKIQTSETPVASVSSTGSRSKVPATVNAHHSLIPSSSSSSEDTNYEQQHRSVRRSVMDVFRHGNGDAASSTSANTKSR